MLFPSFASHHGSTILLVVTCEPLENHHVDIRCTTSTISSLKATKLSETCKHVQDLPCTGKDEKTQSNKRSHWQSWGSQNLRPYPSHGQGSSEGTRSNLPHQCEIRHVELHSTSWDQSAIILGSHLACDRKTANKDIKPPDMVHKKKTMYNGNHYPSETMCTYFKHWIDHDVMVLCHTTKHM
jgi:hypothetical protein